MWSKADPEDILDPYHNIDMKLQYNTTAGQLCRLFSGKSQPRLLTQTSLGLCLEVCDVLDIQYEHIPRYPMPGRNYKLTLSIGI